MKHFIPVFAFVLAAMHGQAQSKNTALPIHKMVIQLSSSDTLVWKGLMNNLRNLKAGWGDSVLIEVVAHGPGIELLQKQKTTQVVNITNATAKGISFIACENTMREKGIKHEDILQQAQFVKMGVGHIVIRQEEGWSYIKAGF